MAGALVVDAAHHMQMHPAPLRDRPGRAADDDTVFDDILVRGNIAERDLVSQGNICQGDDPVFCPLTEDFRLRARRNSGERPGPGNRRRISDRRDPPAGILRRGILKEGLEELWVLVYNNGN